MKIRKGSLILMAVAAGFIALVFYDLGKVEPVEVVDSRLVHVGAAVRVEGHLKNTGSKASDVMLDIRYFDDSGRPLAADHLDIGKIPPGARRDFRSPEHSLAGISEFSLALNHRRNPFGN